MGIFTHDDRLVAPGETARIKSEQQFVDVINYTYDNEEWYYMPKCNCSFLGGNRSPLLWYGKDGWLEQPHIKTGMLSRYDVELDKIETTPEIENCIKTGSGILFIGPMKKIYDVMPVDDGAMYSVLENCGLNCPGFKRDGEKLEKDYNGEKVKVTKKKKENGKNKFALPLNEKAEHITRFYGLEEGDVQVMAMDGYVLSFFSSQYVQLPMKEIYDRQFKPWLEKNFPNHVFMDGEYSHRLLWATFNLGDCEAIDTIKGIFSHAGYTFNNVSLTSRIASSDTRQGSLMVKLDIMADGIFVPLGKLIKFSHRNNITGEMVGEALDKSLLLIKDSDKEFERLMLTPVKHPALVCKKILKHDNKEFLGPISHYFTTEVMELTEKLDGAAGTGIDIYVSAVRAMDKWKKEKNPSPQKFFAVTEAVTEKILFDSMLERDEE